MPEHYNNMGRVVGCARVSMTLFQFNPEDQPTRIQTRVGFPSADPTGGKTRVRAMSFPYSYVSCSCIAAENVPKRAFASANGVPGDEEQEEKTFDPRSARANFSLSPLDHLMWCEDCNDIRCERCVISEIAYWYCPSCLFEVPSSMVKSEGNR